LAEVRSANTRPPVPVSSSETYGSLVFWSIDTRALATSAPGEAFFSTTKGPDAPPWSAVDGAGKAHPAARPATACSTRRVVDELELQKRRLPMSAFARSFLHARLDTCGYPAAG
jgi:hypothetical protein